MENILEVKNLNKEFKDFSLRNISFEIPKGSIVGLVGENGSGKTTTIKSILNIIRRDRGQVTYFGQNLDEFEVDIKENLGVVLDGTFFYDSLTSLDIEKVLSKIHKSWDGEKFFAYLEKFKIPRDKKIKDLSKGTRTKLSIASALSHQSRLLILDEPTSGLDPIVRVEILDELLDFIQDGEKSVLFSTHITSDLDKLADYISFLHQGEMVFFKDREELLTNYGIVKTSMDDLEKIPKDLIIRIMVNAFGVNVLVKDRLLLDSDFIVDRPTTEDIMLFYTRGVEKWRDLF